MRERPILFSGPMVRALLNRTKTQTRRIVKLPHLNPLGRWEVIPWGGPNGGRTRDGRTVPYQNAIGHSRTGEVILSPYGSPGDALWVKETWRTAKSLDEKSPSAIAESCVDAGYRKPWAPLVYEADGHRNEEWWRGFEFNGDTEPGKTRVSIHMPRWASRIDLEITRVRVERLQDISAADAEAEGVDFLRHLPDADETLTATQLYACLWDSINAAGRPVLPENPESKRYARVKAWLEKHPDTTSWAANPWVWVIEFRRLKP